jgi:hypothetical protein
MFSEKYYLNIQKMQKNDRRMILRDNFDAILPNIPTLVRCELLVT